ncbi:MAG: transglutaminase domain-containing protein [Sandaracinus sp.]|nr:transglutaminase domain-containing protein [Sandaracinus sp.]
MSAEAEREGWVPLVLRAIVHALAAGVLAYPLASGGSVAAAAVGSGLGAAFGPRVSRSDLRSVALVALGVGGVLLGFGVRFLFVDTQLFASSLGPSTSLRTGDWLFFLIACGAVSLMLRALATRRRGLQAIEVVIVGVAFAQLVVAHRQGAINRPFEIADPILASGGDPTDLLFAVGGAATAVVILLLLGERSLLRSLLHLSVVALLLLLFLGTSRVIEMPEPPEAANGLGLRPEEGEGEGNPDEGGEGNGGGSSEPQPNEELQFQDELEQPQSATPVGVVIFHDDWSPPYGVYYLRQAAFSQYNGRRLVAATQLGVDGDLARDFPTVAYDVAEPPPMGSSRAQVETTVALLAEHTRPFGLEAPVRFIPARNPDARRFRRVYKVTSAVLTADFASMLGARAGDPTWSADERATYTAAPDDPRYAELAQRILQEQLPDHLRDDPAARIAAITGWLGDHGTYSLRSRHAGADDPTADFLFGDLTGYCVHFAHAAAYLMRAAGLPTRVASGYAIDESTRQGGSALLVTGGASHAWPEVYLEGFGWVVADVTPAQVLTPPGPPPDVDLQRLLGELARGLDAVPVDEDAPVSRTVATLRDVLTWIGWGLLGLLASLFVFLVLGKAWRRLAPRFASADTRPLVSYRAALDQLGEVALRRERGESREAFARRVAEIAPSFDLLTRANVGAAFGSRRVDAGSLESVRAKLGQELARAFPLWRRFVGRLAFWSWLGSR